MNYLWKFCKSRTTRIKSCRLKKARARQRLQWQKMQMEWYRFSRQTTETMVRLSIVAASSNGPQNGSHATGKLGDSVNTIDGDSDGEKIAARNNCDANHKSTLSTTSIVCFDLRCGWCVVNLQSESNYGTITVPPYAHFGALGGSERTPGIGSSVRKIQTSSMIRAGIEL